MANERKLTVVIAGDAKGLDTALGSTGTKVDGFAGKVNGLGVKAKAAMAGAGLAVIAFGKSSVDAYQEAEEAQSKLAAAFEKFPQLANGNIETLRKLNTELAKKTKFDDDATASGQAVLAQFGLTESQLVKLTPLLQDYAERTGKDLPTAAQDLGKAVLGQGRSLKAVGINFKDTGDKAANLDQIIAGLDKSVGGFAETAGKTTSGKVQILRNQFGELQEKVGGALVPVLLKLADAGLKVVDFFDKNQGALIAFGAIVGTVLVSAFIAWAASIGATVTGLTILGAPVIAVVAAVAALAAGVVYAYTHFEVFRNTVDAVGRFLRDQLWPALQVVAGFITEQVIPVVVRMVQIFVEWHMKVAEIAIGIVSKLGDVVGFVASMPGKIASAASGMWNGITSSFKSAINSIIRLWNGLHFPSVTVGGGDPLGAFGPSLPKVTIGGWELPNIPLLEAGAIVKARPGGILANIGEGRYDEAVVPLKPGMGMGGPTVVINFNSPVMGDENQIRRWLVASVNQAVDQGFKLKTA